MSNITYHSSLNEVQWIEQKSHELQIPNSCSVRNRGLKNPSDLHDSTKQGTRLWNSRSKEATSAKSFRSQALKVRRQIRDRVRDDFRRRRQSRLYLVQRARAAHFFPECRANLRRKAVVSSSALRRDSIYDTARPFSRLGRPSVRSSRCNFTDRA